MEDQNNATSVKHQRSASNAPNDKRQKMTTPSCQASPFQNEGVLAAMNKLTQLVEHHPQLHSKLEGILEDVFNALESLRFLPPFEKKRMKIHVQSSNCRMMNSRSSLVMWVRSSMVLLRVF